MVASCHVKDALSAMTMLFFGLVVLVNIGIRADSSQRDLTRSRAELNAVTYADHMKADIVRGIDITNLAKPLDIEDVYKRQGYVFLFIETFLEKYTI